jgi:hypothetical protein
MKKHILCFSFMLGIVCQLVFCHTLSAQGIMLVNDTIDLTPLIPKTVNILANDIIPPGDSIKIFCGGGGLVNVTNVSGGFYTFTAYSNGYGWGSQPIDTGGYHIVDYTLDTVGAALLIIRISDNSYDSLTVNDINARFQAGGSHFFGPYHARFEVPKYSGKNTIYSSTLWIGGLDSDSVLHLAGQTYGQGPGGGNPNTKFDFWAGPVMDSAAYSIYQDTLWNYIWNLRKSEIEYHKLHWSDAGYQPVHDILTWPGNGNVSLGQAAQLAPYYDRNSDGIYNPMDGDYPLIRGDQALFFIFNDDRNMHMETQGYKLKVEVHGMAYAFDLPGDSAFSNTVFLNYKIINRSDNIYYNTEIGVFTDLDIGYWLDDYVGCNVERSYYYGYNGDSIDGTGQPWAYGAHPPAQSVTILGGPTMDPDGVDNPRVDNTGHPLCNESVNGLNFGDSIVDNERLGMTRFMYYNNDNTVMGNPVIAADYYYYMNGKWKNGDLIANRFMFNGQSDTLNWGTGCVLTTYSHLTEALAGNAVGDRRGVGSSGPFTFNPGQEEEFDLCYTFARDYHGNGSLGILQDRTDTIRKSYIHNVLPDGASFNGIAQTTNPDALQAQIFPNPASSAVNIRFNRIVNDPVTIRIFDSSGSMIRLETVRLSGKMMIMDVSRLSSGLYLVSIETSEHVITKKVSILK